MDEPFQRINYFEDIVREFLFHCRKCDERTYLQHFNNKININFYSLIPNKNFKSARYIFMHLENITNIRPKHCINL